MRRLSGLLLAAGLLYVLSPNVATQSAQLRIVDAAPKGELADRDQANEIRLVFSEPMVALGRVPPNPVPTWVHITPAIKGTFRWSGTTVLVFTPDSSTPLPYGTRYAVTVDATATSDAGRRLGTAFDTSFTTPTLKLTSMEWYRRQNRADQPVVLVLQFNQRVNAATLLPRLTLRHQAHEFEAPEMPVRARARLATTDPDGPARFDAKVATARQAAARTTALGLRITTDWNKERFPAKDSQLVLETQTAPTPGTWLQLTMDAQALGAEGTVRPSQVQRSTAELDPVFFAKGFGCVDECDPSSYNGVGFSAPVSVATFSTALTVRDITAPTREQPVARRAAVTSPDLDQSSSPSLEDAGYDRQPPATTYAYRLDPTLASADGQTLGYPWMGIVQTWHERAFTSFGDGHGVWELDGGPQLPFYSRNLRDVTQWFRRILPADLVTRIVALDKNDFRDVPPGAGTTRRLTVTPDATQSYGMDLTPALTNGTGLVWVGLRPGATIPQSNPAVPADHADRSSIIQVTNLGISVKDSPQSTLVFVTRLDNGDPVAGATVTIINTDNRQLWRGVTGNDGVAMAPALPMRKTDDWYPLSFVVTAERNGDVAYLASNWNEGIMPWDFGHNYQLAESTDILRGSIFTDRGVYKPGEEVHVKAIVRADTPTGVRLMPAGATLDISVRDSRNHEVDRRTITLNRWSSAEWTWAVPASSTLGEFAIHASLPKPAAAARTATGNDSDPDSYLKEVEGSFYVAAYRRPDFRVDAALSADTLVAGATLNGRLDARYLFGNPMASRPVTWSVTREVSTTVPAAILEKFPEEKYAFGYSPDEDSSPERIAGQKATLDPAGLIAVNAATTRDVDLAYRYTLEGDVEDVSRQHIANRASLIVHPAPWYVGLRRPPFFATAASGTSVDVVAVDLSGTPVAGVPVTVALTRVQWNSVRRAEGGGFYTWDTEVVRVPAGQWAVTSAASPFALAIPVPEGGEYEITATARDAEGHKTKTNTSFYVVGKGYTAWERYDHNRIDLEPEKKTWKAGETARLMIKSPWESATALLTVEREGIRRYQRFTLTSTQQTVEVPITENDIPNVFVSVLLIRGRTSKDPGADGNDPGKPTFRLGYAELKVEDATKRLTMTVAADREEYRPANVAHVSVSVKDAAGRPAASEVTLWAVDHGVLSLTDYRAPDVLHAIYQDKSLQVMNEDSRQRIVSRRVITPKGDGEGGGGGSDGPGDTRRDFRPLAFWLGSVDTDAAGVALRDVTLPESLTTYRIMAVAADGASRFGSGSAEIRVSKPVTIVTAFPRFLTLGDRASFGGVVTNTLATGGNATITIRSLDPRLLQFEGKTSQTVAVGAHATEPVRFDAIARGVGGARVQMTVRLNNQTDAFETTLPVSAPAPIETDAAFGDTDNRAAERLVLPTGILPGVGGLHVELASSALVGLGEGARYLSDYAFGCAEQKSSAALALVLAADLGQAFSMGNTAPADYRAKATSLLRELPRFQCSSGAFTLWPGACVSGNVYLTAYVLHVMQVAEPLGFPSDKDVVSSALTFLEDELKKATPPGQAQWVPVWNASRAFAVKVLAEHGRNQDSNITRMIGSVDRLPVFALSHLADAIAASGTRGARYQDVVRRITNALRVEGDRAHVEEADREALAWIWTTNTSATAMVLDGFVRRGDAPASVPGMVRWLLASRTDGRWGNTQENATALEALVKYYKAFETDVPNMTATVALGGRAVGTSRFEGRSSTTQRVDLAMPDLVRQVAVGTTRELALSRAGTGRLFYTTRLQYSPTEPLAAADAGMHVERRYERFIENRENSENGDGTAATTFAAGDLIRVTLAITAPQERRYVAVTDALPAGLEAVDSWLKTTASDLAKDNSVESPDGASPWWFERGGFDHVEKYDDRVVLFATRLGEGRHQFSYLVRATTAGTFRAVGTTAEEMYAPEVKGRSAPVTITVQ